MQLQPEPIADEKRSIAWIWLFATLIVLMVGSLQIWENQKRAAALNESQTFINAQHKLNEQTVRDLNRIHETLPRAEGRRSPLMEDFRLAVGPGFSLLGSPSNTVSTYLYTDPATSGQAEITVYWNHAEKIRIPFSQYGTLNMPHAWVATIRRLVYIAGFIIWVAILMTTFAERNQEARRYNGHLMLVVAVTSTVLAFLGNRHFGLWLNLFQNDSPAWGYIMIPISLMLMYYYPRWSESPSEPTCRKCGYNLTGNLSGICPECGQSVARTQTH